MWGPMMGYHYGYGAWMMAATSVFWLVLLVIAAVLVWRLAGQPGRGPSGPRSSAIDMLDERYARGEIQRDEYLQKRADLLGKGAA